MERYIYRGSAESLAKALELHGKGIPVYCPICEAPLKILATREEAGGEQRHPGIYCPVDERHVLELFNLRPSPGFWSNIKKRP